MRLAFLLVFVLLASPAMAQQPMNVLWICADDFAAYTCGAYGNPLARTPNIDRLAARGLRFDRAYCNAPVCTASRQSFLTGRYPRTVGVTQLKTALSADETTLPEMLTAAGYLTAGIGKMHFNSNLSHGFAQRTDMPDHARMLLERGRQDLPAGLEVQPPWRPFKDPASLWLNSSVRPFAATDADMPGTFFAQRAAEFLITPRKQPFFLMVSFYEPHSPFNFPVEYAGKRQPSEFTAPPVSDADQLHNAAIFRDLSEAERQGIQAAYYTSVEFLDKNVGLVLDALEKSGQADNTLVVFTGDHGYMLGQHGRFEKHCGYEPAIRVPLILSLPGGTQPASESAALVELIDVVPTILDWCRLATPDTVQGRSLLKVCRGETSEHRQHVFIEYLENEEAYIRTGQHKLIYCTGKRQREDGYATGHPLAGRTIQLFDLEKDPDETTNLADEAPMQPMVTELLNQLATHLKTTQHADTPPAPAGDIFTVLDYCLIPRDK